MLFCNAVLILVDTTVTTIPKQYMHLTAQQYLGMHYASHLPTLPVRISYTFVHYIFICELKLWCSVYMAAKINLRNPKDGVHLNQYRE